MATSAASAIWAQKSRDGNSYNQKEEGRPHYSEQVSVQKIREINTKGVDSQKFKGIDRPFGGGVERVLIRSLLLNWRLGYFFYLILKGLLHKIIKKPLDAA